MIFITNVIFHSFIFFLSFPFSILIPACVREHDIFQIKRKSFHYLFGNQFHAIWNGWVPVIVEFFLFYCSEWVCNGNDLMTSRMVCWDLSNQVKITWFRFELLFGDSHIIWLLLHCFFTDIRKKHFGTMVHLISVWMILALLEP